MANGAIHDEISDQYLQQFDKSIGVSGMQKLQSFPELQKLGYNGQLSHLKKDFHGLQDFKSQMDKYSSSHPILKIAWSLIKYLVPNNVSIQQLLFTAPGLGTVGNAFKSIHGFGQVFSLSPGDLLSPSAVSAKASVYKDQSVQSSVVEETGGRSAIGGASPSSSGNASLINGFLVVGTPSPTNNTLKFDGTNLVWSPGGATTDSTGSISGILDADSGLPLAIIDCGAL